jgi:hypothetical protein
MGVTTCVRGAGFETTGCSIAEIDFQLEDSSVVCR